MSDLPSPRTETGDVPHGGLLDRLIQPLGPAMYEIGEVAGALSAGGFLPATALALVLAVILWLALRENRKRLQVTVVSVAFAAVFVVGMIERTTGIAFVLFGGSGREAAQQATIAGYVAAGVTVILSSLIGWFATKRWVTALALFGLVMAYGLIYALATEEALNRVYPGR